LEKEVDVLDVLKVIQPLLQDLNPVTVAPRYLKVVPDKLTVLVVLSSPLKLFNHPG